MKQVKRKAAGPRIALDQVEQIMAGSGQRADALRGDGFAGLVLVKRAKLVQTRRERARVAERHGEDSAQVAGIDAKMAMEHRFLVGARTEHSRIATPFLERDESAWQVHGYLRNQDGFPREGYTVGIYPDAEGAGTALASTKTSKSGYFHLTLARRNIVAAKLSAAADRGDDTKLKEREKLRLERQQHSRLLVGALRQPVYVGARGGRGAEPTMDTRALHPLPGAIAYRDIIVRDPKDDGDSCHFATRLLGNSGKRELHTLDSEKPGCQLAEIRPDHRVYFQSEAQAERLGYDFCAYCFGKSRSKR